MNDSTIAVSSPSAFAGIGRVPGVAWILGCLVIGFALATGDFLSAPNLLNIGLQSVILLMLALPMTLIIMTEGVDISMGALLTLASVVLAWVLAHDGSLMLALAASLLTGLVFGIANGMLVAFLKMPPFVVTLGTMGIAQGVALLVTDGQSIVVSNRTLEAVYGGSFAGIPQTLLIGAIAGSGSLIAFSHAA